MGTQDLEPQLTQSCKGSRRRRRLPELTLELEDAAALATALKVESCGSGQWSPSLALQNDEPGTPVGPGPDPKRSRRLTEDQVRLLEHSFWAGSPKLETNRKLELASQLEMTPRQVAIWFQNRRARSKTKQLESDCGILRAKMKQLRADYSVALVERDRHLAQVKQLGGAHENRSATLSDSEAVAPTAVHSSIWKLKDDKAAVQPIPATTDAVASLSPGDSCSATLHCKIPCFSCCSSPGYDDESALVVRGMPVEPHPSPSGPVVVAVAGNDGLNLPRGGTGVCWQDSTDSSLTSLTCGSTMSTGVQIHACLWKSVDAVGFSCFQSDAWWPNLQNDAKPVVQSCPSVFNFTTTDVPPSAAAFGPPMTGSGDELPLRNVGMLLADCCKPRAVCSAAPVPLAQLNSGCLATTHGVADQVVEPWWEWLGTLLN